MISELSVTPRASNNRARHLFFISLLLALAVTVVYVSVEKYKGLIGLVIVGLLAAAVYIFNRYMACVLHYDIMIDSDGVPLFIVRKTVGKRHSTLCRVELYTIISVNAESARERREHKTEKGVLKYNYTPSIDPAHTYLITTRSRYERAEIRIEASEEFAALLTAYAREAREMHADDEE